LVLNSRGMAVQATCFILHPVTPTLAFCLSLQVGMAEMKGMVLNTGGMAVQTDTYHNPVFKDSLKRLFQKENEEGFIGCSSNSVLEVCA